MLKEVFTRISEKGIQLEVTARFKTHLIDEGYQPYVWCSSFRRAVMRLLEDTYQKNSFLKKSKKAILL